jgi:hypothetical protein
MKNGAIDLSFRFKLLSTRLNDDSKSTAGKSFKLLDLTFVSQPGLLLTCWRMSGLESFG